MNSKQKKFKTTDNLKNELYQLNMRISTLETLLFSVKQNLFKFKRMSKEI